MARLIAGLLVAGLTWSFADHWLFTLATPETTAYSFDVRHAGNLDLTHAPPAATIEISNANLPQTKVRFRTGPLGNILPSGGRGPCRVVFLGGSTTESHWMPEEKRWPFLVGEAGEFRDYIQTDNFGSGGQNLHHSLLKYLMVVGQLSPAIVVVNHHINDFGKLLNGGYYFLENQSLYDSYATKRDPPPVGDQIRNIAEALLPWSYRQWREFSNRRPLPRPPSRSATEASPAPTPDFRPYFSRLRALNGFLKNEGARLVIITEPNRAEKIFQEGSSAPRTYLESLLKEKRLSTERYLSLLEEFTRSTRTFAAQEHIFFVDAQAEFPLSGEHFYDSIHFSPEGSSAFARFLIPKLARLIAERCRDAPVDYHQ